MDNQLKLICKSIFAHFLILFLIPSVVIAQPSPSKELIEGARQEGNLVWYTAMTVADATKYVDSFTKKYPFIKVALNRKGAGSLLNTVKAESAAGRYVADVVSGGGFWLINLKYLGLLTAYNSPLVKRYPSGFFDPEGSWSSYNVNIYVTVYNTKLVPKEKIPRRYEDLLNFEKIGVDSMSEEWIANYLNFTGDKGLKFLTALSEKNLSVRRGFTLQSTMVAAGEIPISLLTFNYGVEQLKMKDAPIDWVGLDPTFSDLQVTMLIKNAPHPNAAKLFIDFQLSEEGQKIVQNLERVPADPSVKANPARLTEGLKFYPSNLLLSKEIAKYQEIGRKFFRPLKKR